MSYQTPRRVRPRPHFLTRLYLAAPSSLHHLFPPEWVRSSLHNTASTGDDRSLTRLLQSGLAPDSREPKIQATPLMYAASQGQIQIAKLLLEAGADVNARDDLGGTALIRAAESGYTEMVSLLLDAGAIIDAIEPGLQHTALSKAASEGHLDTVRLLVDRGANPHYRMRGKLTASEWTRRMANAVPQKKRARLQCADYLESLEGA